MLPSLRWDEIAGLVEPFASRAAASGVQFQYLSDEGPTTVIISTQRQW
jgi:hypothetical protein